MYKSLPRKTLARIAAASLCCTVLAATVPTSLHAATSPKVEVNGRILYDNLTRIENGRVLIGLRSAAEALGATVDWSEADRRITITRGDNQTTLWVDLPTARVNGTLRILDVPPRIVQGRTIIPYRFVGESLGAHIGWDDATRTAWLWSSLTSYQVQSGDSLWAIARSYGLTVEQLRRANGLHSDALTPGQVLLVPEASQISTFATVSGYTVIGSWGDTLSLQSVQANGGVLTDIATVSHRLRADGTMSGSAQTAILAAAHQQGLRPWLVVQNLDTNGNFSRTIADTFLRNAGARQRFVTNVISVLKDGGFVGLEVDLEDITPSNRPYLSLLMKELKAALSKSGFLLGIAVPAKTSDSPTNAWNGAFDYEVIGAYADRVTLMTYDEHWFGGPSGPIASLPWIDRVLKYSTSVIAAEKLLLGVPAYAYDWPAYGGTASVRSAREATNMAYTRGSGWDDHAASPYITYTDSNGTARILWFEDGRSLAAKFELAAAYGLQGINIWRLGLEDGALWYSLNK